LPPASKGIISLVVNEFGEECEAEVHWFYEESIGKVEISVKEWLE